MKKLLLATTCVLAGSAAMAESHAKEVKLGILIGFTGPIETLTPSMAAAAEQAIAEVNASGLFLDGTMLTGIRADSTCGDAAVAQTAAEKLVTADKVSGIIGGDCSGITGAVLQNVAIPNGIVMISPSATSPGLSTAEDNGLFFRTAPSDLAEAEVAIQVMKNRGVKSFALTYTNNDYGKGLSDAVAAAATAAGLTVTINAAHEDGKADYSAEVGALAAAGGDILFVAGYLDQGGLGIIKASLDSGAFTTFGLGGGMVGESLPVNAGPGLTGSYGQVPGHDPESAGMKALAAALSGIDISSPYTPESYDAAALFALAMQAAGSSNPADYMGKVMDVANAPGEKISVGELAKGLQILKDGGDIDFDGATGVELIGPGEASGRYREVEVQDGKFVPVKYY